VLPSSTLFALLLRFLFEEFGMLKPSKMLPMLLRLELPAELMFEL
jgi:hypothetical protein